MYADNKVLLFFLQGEENHEGTLSLSTNFKPQHSMNEQFITLFISFNHCPTKRQYFFGEWGRGGEEERKKERPASRELRR